MKHSRPRTPREKTPAELKRLSQVAKKGWRTRRPHNPHGLLGTPREVREATRAIQRAAILGWEE